MTGSRNTNLEVGANATDQLIKGKGTLVGVWVKKAFAGDKIDISDSLTAATPLIITILGDVVTQFIPLGIPFSAGLRITRQAGTTARYEIVWN